MAITLNAPNRAKPVMPEEQGRTYWSANGVSADWSGNEIVKADPGAGKSLYITYLEINCVSAISLVVNSDAAALLGPFYFAATAPGVVKLRFERPIQVPANTAIQVDGSGAGNANVYIEGFTV
jgi:hypothetical protein